MRVLTMNIYARHRDWEDRRSVLIEGLKELAPDVVSFQETVVTGDYDQVQDVLGDDYHVFHQTGRSDDGVGASIASRWPFDLVREVDLHIASGGDPTGWIGSLTVAEIAVPEPIGPVVLAHHKPTWQSNSEHVREEQAVTAASAIEELVAGAEVHVVVCGDFDATPDAASIRFWTGRQSLAGMSVYYQDAWEALHPGDPGDTFVTGSGLVSGVWKPRPPRRIDYVLVRCGSMGATLDITGCELAFSEPINGIWASDHFGVVADMSLRPTTTDPA